MQVGDIEQYASVFEFETDVLTGIIIQKDPHIVYYHFLSFCGWSDWIPESELFPLTIS